MRRVYFAYFISIVSHPVFWEGVFLGVSAFLLAKWIHVASVVHNFLAVPVGSAPSYLYNSFFGAIEHGEVMTASVLVLAGLVTVVAGYQLAQGLYSHYSRVLTFNS